MKRFITSFIIFFTIGSTAQASVLRISQPKIELELERGQVYSGETDIENPTEEELKSRVYLEDWKYKGDGSGAKDFGPIGTMEFSASKWITFAPAEVKLEPFSKKTIRYTVNVPEDAQGGNYSVLFFESAMGTVSEGDGNNVLIAGRIGSLFFIRIKENLRRQGEIASLKVSSPEGNRPMEIETTFHNTGNVDITLGGNFLILDDEGKVKGRGDIDKIYTFPGHSDTRKTQWVGRLPKGSYDLLITYDLGDNLTIVKEEKLVVA